MRAAPLRTATTPGEALAVVALCFGWPILLSVRAVAAGFPARQGGFDDLGVLSLVIYETAFALVAIIGMVFGLFYARTGRLWPAVLAHMMWDVVPFLR